MGTEGYPASVTAAVNTSGPSRVPAGSFKPNVTQRDQQSHRRTDDREGQVDRPPMASRDRGHSEAERTYTMASSHDMNSARSVGLVPVVDTEDNHLAPILV